jgi:hypothetical protein
MMDGVVIFVCIAILMGFFAHQCVKVYERSERLQFLYNELGEKSPLHKAFIDHYRLCSPALIGSQKLAPGADCLGHVVQVMKPLSPSLERLFEVEQDVRLGEQPILSQTTTRFLNK